MNDREAFEKWVCQQPQFNPHPKEFYLNLNGLGEYASIKVQGAWEGWQAALQAMQGEADTKTYTNLCQKGSAPQPAVPEEVYTALVGVCTAACDGVVLVRYEDWNKIVDWVNALLSATKGE